MTSLNLRLPDWIHRKVREIAAQESISINQFIASAVAEKLSAVLTVEHLRQRAARGSLAEFRRILARVPDRPPAKGDELPAARATGGRVAKPGRARRSRG